MRLAVSILGVVVLAFAANGQTNAPTPYTPTPATPEVTVPTPIVPQPAPIEIPSATNPPPVSTNIPSSRLLPPNWNAPTPAEMAAQPMRWQPPPKLTLPPTQPVNLAPVPVITNLLAAGNYYYVSPDGSDEYPGTKPLPLRTIQRAAELAQPGDTVWVLPGMYDGFHTVRSGEPQHPITFRTTGEVTINRNSNKPADNILVQNTDWIIIAGFTVRDAERAGIAVIDASDVTITNNTCGPNKTWGIFTGFAPKVKIVGNKAFRSTEQHGIYVSNSRVPDDNPVIRGNECYENGAAGIQLNGDCKMGGDGVIDGALIENNVLHDNDSKAFSLISIAGSVIQNNLLYNNGRKNGAGGIHLTDEIGYDKGSYSNVVVNNTIVEPRLAGIRLTDGAHDNVIFNNLIVSRQPIVDEVDKNEIDENSNMLRNSATGIFRNPTANDYRPLTAVTGLSQYLNHEAPARDLAGTVRPTAFAVTCGALEPNAAPLPNANIPDPWDRSRLLDGLKYHW